MWEKMSIRRELPHVTLPCISLWVNHYRSISHNHFWSIQHNHSDHHRVILSQSMSTRSMDSQVWRPTTCHLNLSMSPDTIRAIYLGPLHFVDYDGWDQTSFIVSGTGLLVTLCNAAHVFSLLACEKKRFYHFGLNNVNKQLYQLISSVILLFLPKKVSSWEKFTRVWLLKIISTIDQHNKHDKTGWT